MTTSKLSHAERAQRDEQRLQLENEAGITRDPFTINGKAFTLRDVHDGAFDRAAHTQLERHANQQPTGAIPQPEQPIQGNLSSRSFTGSGGRAPAHDHEGPMKYIDTKDAIPFDKLISKGPEGHEFS